MRLWSLNPSYLDTKGLVAVWREGLLAQSVLIKGEYTECPECKGWKYKNIRIEHNKNVYDICLKCNKIGNVKTPYYNHPQLERFKKDTLNNTMEHIGQYLLSIYTEANERGYNFNIEKIESFNNNINLTVTKGQLKYEFSHLQKKLEKRNNKKYLENKYECEIDHNITENDIQMSDFEYNINPNPLFKVIDGDIESWEKQNIFIKK